MKIDLNFCADIHNHTLIAQAEKLINNFIDEDTIVYVTNPDGSTMELQKGVKLTSISFYKKEL